MIERIRRADTVSAHDFEDAKYFESCLPIEVMVARGDETLRFGPLKPKGLRDPKTGREAHAVIQLRQESREGSLLGLVGFQTRMTYGAQKEVLASIPALASARVLRYGTIHRNIFLNLPEMCNRYQSDRKVNGLYYAGQICGVEGYVECIMSGIVVAMSIYARMQGRDMPPFPDETMIGSLMNYIHTPTRNFQPMNANMGIVPRPDRKRGQSRKERYQVIARRAVDAMEAYRERNAWLFGDARAESA